MTVPYDPSFSLETLTLPHEDPAEHRRLENEWMTAYPCSGPIEKGFLRQAMVAELEKRRMERARATVRAERVRTAVLDFDRQQEDEVARCVDLFSEQLRIRAAAPASVCRRMPLGHRQVGRTS